MASIFFSYTHIDEPLRDELEVHLALLRREGLIEAWHDRRIVAGSNIDDSISEQLEQADIILLLVSANFIASDYCYSREMKRAMERHATGEARVIPVILRACEWHGAPFGKLMAVPTDGRPVTSWPNRDEAFTDIAKSIRKAVGQPTQRSAAQQPPVQTATAPSRVQEELTRSSNLRVKHEFSDFDRDTFLSGSFDFIARFFEGSLTALERRHPEFKGRFERIDSRRFTASIYKGGKAIAECSVSLGGFGHKATEIRYAHGASSTTNGYNEALSVSEDTQKLFLKPMMHAGSSKQEQLSDSGAADYLWAMLMEPIQR